MGFVVDARGLPCPQPVVLTNKAVEEDDRVTTIVDNEIAKNNVIRYAQGKGFDIQVEEKADGVYINLVRKAGAINKSSDEPIKCEDAKNSIVFAITAETIGRGSDELGKVLMTAVVQTIREVEPHPNIVVLMNGGAKLACIGSQVIEDLKDLGELGIEILVCGTCLKHYNLMDKVLVGEVSNTFDILSRMMQAAKVITF